MRWSTDHATRAAPFVFVLAVGSRHGILMAMRVDDILWLPRFIDKVESKHGILPEEVEEVFCNRPKYRRAQRGRVEGEDLYHAYGQTDAGRYVLVVFIYKTGRVALVISARDMEPRERTRHARK